MSFTTTSGGHSAGTMVSPHRGKRDSQLETTPVPAGAALLNGHHEDGREASTTEVPVLSPGNRVLVILEPGEVGQRVLSHALAATAGPLVMLQVWDAVDPVYIAPVGSAGPAVFQSILEDNERTRQEAESSAQAAAAIAQEAGREAIGLVRRLPHRSTLDAQLRLLVSRHGAAHLVLAAPRSGRMRRLLRLRSPHERLAAEPPCALTLVPVPGA